MENQYCTVIDSNGEGKSQWDINEPITSDLIKSVFFQAMGLVLKCGEKIIPIKGPTTLVGGETYVVPVPPKQGIQLEDFESLKKENAELKRKLEDSKTTQEQSKKKTRGVSQMILNYLTTEQFTFLSCVHYTDETQVIQVQCPLNKHYIVKFSTFQRFSCECKILELLKGETHIIVIQQILQSPQQDLYGFVFLQYSLKSFVPKNDIERVAYMYQVLQALQNCLLKGVVHRDLKPSNILHSQHKSNLEIVLADFDHAVIISESSTFSECVGTLPYIAPEMLYSWPTYDYVSDIWSAAVVFCEVLFGINSFSEQENHSELLKAIQVFERRKKDLLQNPTQGKKLWPKAKSLLEGMLESNPEERFTVLQCLEHDLFKCCL